MPPPIRFYNYGQQSRLWKRSFNTFDPEENEAQRQFPLAPLSPFSKAGFESNVLVSGLDRFSGIDNFRIVVMRRWKRELDPIVRGQVERVSRTFARDMVIIDKPAGEKWGFTWHIPYYFAKYVHDGRGAIRAADGKRLIFMNNPNNRRHDPRWATGYPNRKSDTVTFKTLGMTMTDVKEWTPKFRITKGVGPAEAQPFFERARPEVEARAQFILVDTARTFWIDTLNKNVEAFNQSVQSAIWQQTAEMGFGTHGSHGGPFGTFQTF